MLHVRAVDVFVPGQPRQILRLQLAGERGEAHDVEVVLRERRANERVERERHLLRRQEAPAEEHRARDVHEDRGGRLRHELCAVDREVLRRELDRHVRAVAVYRVLHGIRQVEQEWIAELIGLELVGRVTAAASRARAVASERVAFERREDVLERALADLADAARRELVPLAVLADEAGLFEELGHLS